LGLIVVTSDAGFMGGLNGAVIDAAIAESSRPGAEETHLIVIGDKGANVFRDAGRPFRFFQGIPGQDRYERAVEVRDYVVRQVLERRIGRVAVVYPRPLSFTRQVVEVANLLPCATLFEHSGELEAGLLGSPWLRRQAVVESPLSEMAAYLAGVWVTSKLLEIFDDSKLSEFAARAMHLEGSVQKLQQENKKLKYRFFRAAHEHVDKGMRESFTSKKLRDTQKAEKLASADRRARAT
jgi:F0F1-type ATP synthase gamma subunit